MNSKNEHRCEGKQCTSQAEYSFNLKSKPTIYLCEEWRDYDLVDSIHEGHLLCDSDCEDECCDYRGVCSNAEKYKGSCEFCGSSYNNLRLSCYIYSINLELCFHCYKDSLRVKDDYSNISVTI